MEGSLPIGEAPLIAPSLPASDQEAAPAVNRKMIIVRAVFVAIFALLVILGGCFLATRSDSNALIEQNFDVSPLEANGAPLPNELGDGEHEQQPVLKEYPDTLLGRINRFLDKEKLAFASQFPGLVGAVTTARAGVEGGQMLITERGRPFFLRYRKFFILGFIVVCAIAAVAVLLAHIYAYPQGKQLFTDIKDSAGEIKDVVFGPASEPPPPPAVPLSVIVFLSLLVVILLPIFATTVYLFLTSVTATGEFSEKMKEFFAFLFKGEVPTTIFLIIGDTLKKVLRWSWIFAVFGACISFTFALQSQGLAPFITLGVFVSLAIIFLISAATSGELWKDLLDKPMEFFPKIVLNAFGGVDSMLVRFLSALFLFFSFMTFLLGVVTAIYNFSLISVILTTLNLTFVFVTTPWLLSLALIGAGALITAIVFLFFEKARPYIKTALLKFLSLFTQLDLIYYPMIVLVASVATLLFGTGGVIFFVVFVLFALGISVYKFQLRHKGKLLNGKDYVGGDGMQKFFENYRHNHVYIEVGIISIATIICTSVFYQWSALLPVVISYSLLVFVGYCFRNSVHVSDWAEVFEPKKRKRNPLVQQHNHNLNPFERV